MKVAPPPRWVWFRGLAGTAVGVVAGYACSRLHTPIPWMLGPLLSMAVLAISGAADMVSVVIRQTLVQM